MPLVLTAPIEDQKKAFAFAFLKHPDKPFLAADLAFPDVGQAMLAATQWVNDPFVRQHQMDLIEQYGADKFIPTEVDVLNGVYKIADDTKILPEIRLRAYELYAKIKQRYFEKPNVHNTQNNIINQGVMQVVSH